MKKKLLLCLLLVTALNLFSNVVFALEKAKKTGKTPANNRELQLNEIISSGYAYAFLPTKNGNELFCYGEINKMSFTERTNCHRVKATIDKVTGRPIEIVYLH